MTDHELLEAAKKAIENLFNESSSMQKARENLEHLQTDIEIWMNLSEVFTGEN